MQQVLRRDDLPNFLRIKHLSFDPDLLLQDFNSLKNEFMPVHAANGALASLHKNLADQLSDR